MAPVQSSGGNGFQPIQLRRLEEANERLTKELGSLVQKEEKVSSELNTTKDQLQEAFMRIVELTQLTQKLSEDKVAMVAKFKDPQLRKELANKEKELSDLKEAQ